MPTPDVADSRVGEDRRRELVEAARDFAQREIAPHAGEWDENKAYPAHTIKRLGELGFLGLLVSEDMDGLGLDSLTYLMMVEEIAAAKPDFISVGAITHSSPCLDLSLKVIREENPDEDSPFMELSGSSQSQPAS